MTRDEKLDELLRRIRIPGVQKGQRPVMTGIPEIRDDGALVDLILNRASRSDDPHVIVLSVLRTVANYIYYVGRNEIGSDDDILYRIRLADGDSWLDGLGNEIEARSLIPMILDGEG